MFVFVFPVFSVRRAAGMSFIYSILSQEASLVELLHDPV